MASNVSPLGCGPNVDSLYYNLCDLTAVWGIVLEAIAAAGVVFSFVLLISLLATLPFLKNNNYKSSVALDAGVLVFNTGLFCLTFAVIVKKDFATVASRQFLYGVFYAGNYSCLLMQSVRLNILARRNTSPPAWALCLGALGLWLVEVIINTEWLVLTLVRTPLNTANTQSPLNTANTQSPLNTANTQSPLNATNIQHLLNTTNMQHLLNTTYMQRPHNTTNETIRATDTPPQITNQDFVMSLIYVMTLILAVVVSGMAIMGGKHSQWKKQGAFVVLTSLLSVGIWVAWIVMYVYGNELTGGPNWDDPTLAIALVSTGWVFVIMYSIPQICCLTNDEETQQDYGEDLYPNRGVGYETILKEQSSQNMFMENKAFSMDEPNQGSKPVSPYSGYTGQLRSSVYQPTELALITKAVGNQPPEQSFDMIIPRASAGSAANSGSSTPSTHTEAGNTAHTHTSGLNRTSQW